MSNQPPYNPQQQPRFTPNEGYAPPQGPGGPGYYPPQPGPGGPGYYPPQPPPPRKKRHWVRNTILGFGALIVVIVIISVAASGGSGVSTKPSGEAAGTTNQSPSPAASKAPAVASVGAYFDVKDESGDTYRVTLVKVIDPAQGADQFTTPDNGNRFVGAVFSIQALSGSPQNEDANDDAAMVGSNGQTYNSDVNSIAGYTNFSNGQINVAQGESTTGAVTFQVPTDVKVTKVQWSSSAGFGSTVQWNVP